jgi:hypothetical protein
MYAEVPGSAADIFLPKKGKKDVKEGRGMTNMGGARCRNV